MTLPVAQRCLLWPRPALSLLLATLTALTAQAQGGANPAIPATPTAFVAQVDREDISEVGATAPTVAEIQKGLLPELLESPEKRAERERCERLIANGFKCMPPERSYTRFSLPGLNFAVGSTVVPDGMKAQLRQFADALRGQKVGGAAIRVDGHADASGNADANRLLSQRRAESVRDYLVTLGVDGGMFIVEGFGSSSPRNPQNPMAAENRRVEIARNLVRR